MALTIMAVPYAIYQTSAELTKISKLTDPVVANMRIIDARRVPNSNAIYIHVKGDKIRSSEECGPPIAISATYGSKSFESIVFLDDLIVKREGLLTPEILSLGEDDNVGELRNPYAREAEKDIDFGWWKLVPYPDFPALIFTVFHDCGVGVIKSVFTMTVPKPTVTPATQNGTPFIRNY